MRHWPAPFLVLVLAAPVARPQEPREPEPPAVFKADTQVVVLDVVARDKKGRTVKDLRREDFTVLEEGAEKAITGFRFVEKAPDATPSVLPGALAAEVAAAAPDEVRSPILVTFVFDALGTEGRSFARRAALDLLKREKTPGVLHSVFHVGLRLRMLQQFTPDRESVAAAVELACGKLDPRGPMPTPEQVAQAAERVDAASQAVAAADAMTGPAAAGAAGAAAVEAAFANVEREMLRLAENTTRQQQGNTSLFSLFALARQQQGLAGRKAIVYFSEGLQVPGSLESLFRSVISEANRSNVSVYSVDVRGLVTGSDSERTRGALRESGDLSRRQVQARGAGRAVRREDVMAQEMAEEAITMNVQGMLGSLAESTGGRLIANSNDVGRSLERAVADLAGYYEITYDPRLAAFDGRFRKVEVRVARKDVEVQTRAGYFALPPGEGSVNFPWELPLARALSSAPPPRDFDFRLATWHFGREAGGVRHTLVAEIPLDRLVLVPDGTAVRAHVSVMAVLRDERGRVVERFSQDSPFEAPAEKIEALRRGNALFVRSFVAGPGRHRLEVVVMDQRGGKASVRRSVLLVPQPVPGFALSSLALVKRMDAVVAGALDSPDPLRLGDRRVVPWVGEPVLRAGESLSAYVTAFAPGGAERPPVSLELTLDGAVVWRASPELPPPDASGRSSSLAVVPLEGLVPGRYELAAVVEAGGSAQRERAFFAIAN